MSAEPDQVSAAEAEVAAVKMRIGMTADALKQRLDPRVAVVETAQSALAKTSDLFDQADTSARRHPLALTVGGLALGVLTAILTRRRSVPRSAPKGVVEADLGPVLPDAAAQPMNLPETNIAAAS